jgi:C1A family cysteine protease
MTYKVSPYGWRPDKPDQRDFAYKVPKKVTLPKIVDLRPNCPDVYDQGELGSCTANAIAAAVQFDMIKQNNKNPFMPSRLFIYFNERVMEHTVNSDAGAEIRDGIKSVVKQGVCPESLWKYNIPKFTIKPPATAYKAALKEQAMVYNRLNVEISSLKNCLAQGFPFVFGMSVYSSFESDKVTKNGIVPMPKPKETLMGGHAVMCVGYDDTKKWLIVRNSWGLGWGDKGYFYLPYTYINTNLTDDFWVINVVE